MALALRHRLVLTVVPLLALTAILGAAGLALLHRLGGRIDVILRENYDSVLAMERLNEALERIDSSFQFALTGAKQQEQKARRQYAENWQPFLKSLETERNNITEKEFEHSAGSWRMVLNGMKALLEGTIER